MKKIIVPALLSTAVILTACGNNDQSSKKESTTTETAQTINVKDTASLIQAAELESKNIQSYASAYTNDAKSGSKNSHVAFTLKKDKDDNQKITVKNSSEDTTFYVYKKKTILKQNGKWVDASTLIGTQLISQTEPLLYNSQFKLIKQLDKADYKKTADGYTLTQSFSDYKKYKELFGNTKENRKVMDELKKQYPSIKGKIEVQFNDKKQLTNVINLLTLKNKKTTVDNNVKTTFEQLNGIDKLDVPAKVKNAEEIAAEKNN